MRIAVFHHSLDNIGGAEIVTLELARGLGADVVTTNISEEKIRKMGFADILPRMRSIGTLPSRAPFRQQLALWKFRRLDLSREYDFFIICGDWAMSAAVRNKPNLWYVHSPLNEIWQFKDHVRSELVAGWKRPVFDLWVAFNRALTRRYAKRVGAWVANSENTRGRIQRFYEKKAAVIEPPIDCAKLSWKPSEGYWLSVNRLVAHKRIELQLEAFRNLPNERLVMVGSYEKGVAQFEEYRAKLEALAPANVEFRSWASDAEIRELYARCKGFITTARDEDFGMTAVEAMAAGKPVIAPNEGGYRESVLDGATGVLLEGIESGSLARAIEKLGIELAENPLCYRDACIARAQRFDSKRFIERIRALLTP